MQYSHEQHWNRQRRGRTWLAIIAALVASLGFSLISQAAMVALLALIVPAVAIAKWLQPVPVVAIAITAVLGTVATRLPGATVMQVVEGTLTGFLVTLVLAGPALIVNVIQNRRAFGKRGWELADSAAHERDTAVEAALQRERMVLAAEIHDGLGHQLTLLTVQIGQLAVKSDLPDDTQNALVHARVTAADAVEQLNESISVLRQAQATDPNTVVRISDVIDKARTAGMTIRAQTPQDVEQAIGSYTQSALVRALQETLTNAAKHAEGAPVHVTISLASQSVYLVVRNPVMSSDSESSGGFGLLGLQERVAILGGRCHVGTDEDEFQVELSLPVDARPQYGSFETDIALVSAERAAAAARSDQATRSAIRVPAIVLSAITCISIVFYAFSATLSVLPAEEFQQIARGQSMSQAQQFLPAWQMLDAPRNEVPAAQSETCRYYERSVSFFERVDVHVVCSTEDQVSRTEVIPAP